MAGERNLVVLIGAGASYDCASGSVSDFDVEFRPPLTKELFAFRPSFNSILKKYPGAESLSDEIRSRVNLGESIEAVLREIAERPDIKIRRQYWEVLFYLQELLGEIGEKYIRSGVTKFVTLLNAIINAKFDSTLILSLNYDLLVEQAFARSENRRFHDLNSYLSQGESPNFIKLHGSANWGRQLLAPVGHGRQMTEILDSLTGEPQLASVPRVLAGYRETHRFVDGLYHFPALSEPIQGSKHFSCPDVHLKKARELLSQRFRLLVIGFSGLDEHVLELLRPAPRLENLCVVNGSKQFGMELINKIPPINNQLIPNWTNRELEHVHDGGFESFMRSGSYRGFLS